MEDVLPSLLEKINQDFDERAANSKKLKQSMELLKTKKATYIQANEFGIEVGQILSDVLGTNVTVDVLPDGKMYFNIADRLFNSILKKNFDLISGYSTDVQSELNQLAGFKLKSQVPELNQDRIDGIVNRISSEDDFEKILWLLKEPIVTFSQSVVDDTLKKNIDFQAKAGLKPKIVRKLVGKACDWCRNLAGSYDYPNVPSDVYHRHERCRCTVEYDPRSIHKLRQDVWSKNWVDPDKDAKIAERKNLNLKKRG